MICFFIPAAAAIIVCPLLGSESIDLKKALDFSVPASENPDRLIFFYARLPRCLLAVIVGAALAGSGVTFQSMLKNPLATPYTLGLAGGSSLASVIVLAIGGGIITQPPAAFVGAFLTLTLVYMLGKKGGRMSHVTLILAGVTLNLFFSAIIMLIQYISDPARTFFIINWLMGNLDIASYNPVYILLPFQIVGLGLLLFHSRDMNLLSLDELSARSLGLNVKRATRNLYVAGSLVAGTAIAFSGPIGFVGLIVPHAIRIIIGPDHRLLLPASILTGGAFLLICDTIARIIIAPTELPVGVITALLGGPFFLWLLLNRRKGGMLS